MNNTNYNHTNNTHNNTILGMMGGGMGGASDLTVPNDDNDNQYAIPQVDIATTEIPSYGGTNNVHNTLMITDNNNNTQNNNNNNNGNSTVGSW